MSFMIIIAPVADSNHTGSMIRNGIVINNNNMA